MKYRKSYFSELTASDYAKLTYGELLINDFTNFFVKEFSQDVMRMTTKDWLWFPVRIILLPLLPLSTYLSLKDFEHRSIRKVGGLSTYSGITLYWRDVSDFASTPDTYLKK